MKKPIFIFFLFFFIASIGIKQPLFAQTDRELLLRLLDRQDKLAEQMSAMDKRLSEQMVAMDKKLTEQMVVIEKKIIVLETKTDGVQKQLDILVIFVVGIISFIAVLIGVIFWDRRTAMKPLEEKLEKEIALLKESNIENKNIFKKIAEKIAEVEPRFLEIFKNAGIL